MRKFFSISLLLLVFQISFLKTSYAQENNLSKLNIKILPSTIFEPTGGLQLGLECLMFPNVSFLQDFAYLNSQSSILNSINKYNIEGFRTCSEIRFYFTNDKKENLYFSTNVVLKKTTQLVDVSVDRLDGAYSQFYSVDKNKNVFAFHVKFGNQISFENIPIIMDLYIGIGYRHLTIDRVGIPADEEIYEHEFNTRSMNGVYNAPSFTSGVKIGLKIF